MSNLDYKVTDEDIKVRHAAGHARMRHVLDACLSVLLLCGCSQSCSYRHSGRAAHHPPWTSHSVSQHNTCHKRFLHSISTSHDMLTACGWPKLLPSIFCWTRRLPIAGLQSCQTHIVGAAFVCRSCLAQWAPSRSPTSTMIRSEFNANQIRPVAVTQLV